MLLMWVLFTHHGVLPPWPRSSLHAEGLDATTYHFGMGVGAGLADQATA